MKALCLLMVSLMLLTSCLLISNTILVKITLKLGHNQDKSHTVRKALSYLADRAKECFSGESIIRIYPNVALGNERESLELMNFGALQMVRANVVSLESLAPDYGLSSLSFSFRDRDHYYRVLQSDLGKKILNSSEGKGSIDITHYGGGTRGFYSDKPTTKPGDLAGMKIRVQQGPSAIAMVKALSGVATPMTQGELYTTLQQEVVGGGENNTIVYTDMRRAEVVKVCLRDEHTVISDVLAINTGVLNKLGNKEHIALSKAASESTMQMKGVIWPAAEKEAYDKMKGMSVTIVDADKSIFRERVKPLYGEFKVKDAQSAKNLKLVGSM